MDWVTHRTGDRCTWAKPKTVLRPGIYEPTSALAAPSSTVRRSFAALLRQKLALTAQPRNLAKPERPANFGLPLDQDEQLTRWMRSNLRIATWIHDGRLVQLRDLERQVLAQWLPPLNLIDVRTPWTAQVKAARRIMADQARATMNQS